MALPPIREFRPGQMSVKKSVRTLTVGSSTGTLVPLGETADEKKPEAKLRVFSISLNWR